ncbi:hypothetical protein V2G26_001831 [Clonostachys chloroleuca]
MASRRWLPGDENCTWNLTDLTNTYGVYSDTDFRILDFIERLGAKALITQGSSRSEGSSGTQLFTRNLSPRINPLYDDFDRIQQMFWLYKLFSRVISFWRSTASDKRTAGVSCCQCCATFGQDDICSECSDVLEDADRYTWMKDCLLGKSPFTLTDSDPFSLNERMRKSHKDNPRRSPLAGGRTDDEDWVWDLDFYSPLEAPFNNIIQLHRQREKYDAFRWQNEDFGRRKRERSLSVSDDQRSERLFEANA